MKQPGFFWIARKNIVNMKFGQSLDVTNQNLDYIFSDLYGNVFSDLPQTIYQRGRTWIGPTWFIGIANSPLSIKFEVNYTIYSKRS